MGCAQRSTRPTRSRHHQRADRRRHRRARPPWQCGHRAREGRERRRRRSHATARTIDARGRVLAPGFIDMHSHSDMPLVTDGNAQSKIRQGVTTEVIGESGSIAPRRANRWRSGGGRRGPTSTGYFGVLEKNGIAVNLLSYIGLGTVRELVIGEGDRPATAAEIKAMQALVAAAMKQGRVRCLDRPDLSAQRLREPRGTRRAVIRGGADGRAARVTPALRRRQAARRHRGDPRRRRAQPSSRCTSSTSR